MDKCIQVHIGHEMMHSMYAYDKFCGMYVYICMYASVRIEIMRCVVCMCVLTYMYVCTHVYVCMYTMIFVACMHVHVCQCAERDREMRSMSLCICVYGTLGLSSSHRDSRIETFTEKPKGVCLSIHVCRSVGLSVVQTVRMIFVESMCVYMCVSIYMCVCLHVYVCIYMYIYTHTLIHTD
jgi:hypothetical protein